MAKRNSTPVPEGYKRCCRGEKCIHPDGCILPINHFYTDRKNKDGLKRYCKACDGKYKREAYQRNPEKYRQSARETYAKNPEKIREYQRKWYRERIETEQERRRIHRLKNGDTIRERERQRYAENPCKREYDRQWRAANPHKTSEYCKRYYYKNLEKLKQKRERYYSENAIELNERNRQWRVENKERLRKYDRQRYYANPEKQRQRRKRYSLENPEKYRVACQKRRALKRNAIGTFTHEDVELQYRSQRGKCWHCGKKFVAGDNGTKRGFHIDHLFPLSRFKNNSPRNIVLACPKCNLSKHDKMPHEWNGRLF